MDASHHSNALNNTLNTTFYNTLDKTIHKMFGISNSNNNAPLNALPNDDVNNISNESFETNEIPSVTRSNTFARRFSFGERFRLFYTVLG